MYTHTCTSYICVNICNICVCSVCAHPINLSFLTLSTESRKIFPFFVSSLGSWIVTLLCSNSAMALSCSHQFGDHGHISCSLLGEDCWVWGFMTSWYEHKMAPQDLYEASQQEGLLLNASYSPLLVSSVHALQWAVMLVRKAPFPLCCWNKFQEPTPDPSTFPLGRKHLNHCVITDIAVTFLIFHTHCSIIYHPIQLHAPLLVYSLLNEYSQTSTFQKCVGLWQIKNSVCFIITAIL